MNDINLTEVIGTMLLTIIGYVSSQKWIFPFISKCWKWFINRKKEFDEQNVNVSEELLDYKKSNVELQDKTFQVLFKQIENLELELQRYASELEKLRSTILRLNSKLYDKSLLIAELQKKSCCLEDCPHRELCKNSLPQIDDLTNTI